MAMTTYVFPGQGSQHRGMGKDLFRKFPDLVAKSDNLLGYSVEDLCLNDTCGRLGITSFTQPALYVVNALTYLKVLEDTGVRPTYVAGHSLGEYNALFAAGAFDFEQGLQLVIKRGELMAAAQDGGMAAVIGLKLQDVQHVMAKYRLDTLDIANINSLEQIVISGPRADIVCAQPFFEQSGAKLYIPLAVSGAFHSRYMEQAKLEFAEFLESVSFAPLLIPVISNVQAVPYEESKMKELLVAQLTHPVRWTDSIYHLLEQGEHEFLEMGPGQVLTKLIAAIRSDYPLAAAEHPASDAPPRKLTAETLGDDSFIRDYGLKYAYAAGSMYKGISSADMIVCLGRAGMLGFFGSGGLSIEQIDQAITDIQSKLTQGESYGFNLLHTPDKPEREQRIAELYVERKVPLIEASAFFGVTEALVYYRAKGLVRQGDGKVKCNNRILAKLSRPEVAESFMSPAPERLIAKLLDSQRISAEEASLLRNVPVADDITIEADSGGHTDQGIAYVLMPALTALRDRMMKTYQYNRKIRIGAAGGIGTPASAAAAFMLGADFIVTGSINQCTIEANTSDAVKELLQRMSVQDTDYAPAGDMFEIGSKVQVLKKGLFFPSRANKLYELYSKYDSLDEIPLKEKEMLERRYFKRSIEDVYGELLKYKSSEEIERANRIPKHKMALVFKWYFSYSSRLALQGASDHKVDFQIHCGPALGAFNTWVEGSEFENWKARHVDQIGLHLLNATADYMNAKLQQWLH